MSRWRVVMTITLVNQSDPPYYDVARDRAGFTEEYRAEIPATSREGAIAGATKILAAIGEASK